MLSALFNVISRLTVEAPVPPKFFAQMVAPSAAASFSKKASLKPIIVRSGVVSFAKS